MSEDYRTNPYWGGTKEEASFGFGGIVIRRKSLYSNLLMELLG